MKAKVGRGNGFRGLLAYVFGAGEKGKHDRASIVGGNMVGTDPRGLAAEFAICRKLRPEVKNPVWHCSLALPKGERLDGAVWQRVCERHLQLMGIDSENHMWVAVRHDDTDFDHVHLVVSRIGLDGALWHGRNDVRAAIDSTQVLEREFGLQLTPGLSSEPEHPKRTKGEAGRKKRTGQTSLKERMQAILNRAIKVGTFEGFVQVCHEAGLQLIPNLASTGRMNGFSFRFDGEVMKGSDLGSKYKWAKLAEQTGFDPSKHMSLIQELAAAARAREEAKPEDILQADAVAADEEVRPARRNRTIDLLFVRLVDGTYAWKRSQSPAFRDLGDRIRFDRSPDTAVRAALQLAHDKGWINVKVTGSVDFRRRVWMQGQLAGITVTGYQPTGDDIVAFGACRRDIAIRIAHKEADPLLRQILIMKARTEAELVAHRVRFGEIPAAEIVGDTIGVEQHAFAERHADQQYLRAKGGAAADRRESIKAKGSPTADGTSAVSVRAWTTYLRHCERIIRQANAERIRLVFEIADLDFWAHEICAGRMPRELQDAVDGKMGLNALAVAVAMVLTSRPEVETEQGGDVDRRAKDGPWTDSETDSPGYRAR
ncbi:relaxase/mobilization nuclease domain-containing protein [Ralstonia pseudosolanacearum]|uniref:relaxase/mobilization nuclease domain-containing protein n=1 Tax=Ralstonia pseudosolanacearum TaxID=1310165 RepID=UPI003C2F1FDA